MNQPPTLQKKKFLPVNQLRETVLWSIGSRSKMRKSILGLMFSSIKPNLHTVQIKPYRFYQKRQIVINNKHMYT